jgi:tetratricopeptide (TPR) repeat protein
VTDAGLGAGADARVPRYLGRVLDGGEPAGTCFQVAPGVLVTAWHVLEEAGAADEGAAVEIDPLAGGSAFGVTVARVDPVHDLAVLVCGDGPGLAGAHGCRLAESAGPLTATDRMKLREPVSVTGHAAPDDPGYAYRFLVAAGDWAGGTTRNDAIPLGRVTSHDVVKGMSGAPVVRDADGAVAGVVSGRYTSADGWLAGTVWVARSEDLAALLAGIADITVKRPPLAGPAELVLTVTLDQVRLTGAGTDVAAAHDGVRVSLAEAVHEVRRARTRAGVPSRAPAEGGTGAGELPLGRVSRLLGESFLPGAVAAELGRVLAAADAAHQPVRLGLAVTPELAGLPWEALPGPDRGGPLALQPLVSLYRKTEAAAPRVLPGPLRIVVAIAVPDTGGGGLLDYERELRNVLAAVRTARQDAADVRVVPFATPAAIRAELERAAAHVLHISGHGSPGRLDLEDVDGAALPVTADEFIDQVIPPGKMPPTITLSACYTDAAASEDGTSFAARLCQRGACAVVATETSISDMYATRLLARVYGTLAQAGHPDMVAALADARRQVQTELVTSAEPRDRMLASLGEWAAVTVLAASGSVPVLDDSLPAAEVRRPARARIAGLAARDDWYFVGRRPEQRRWPADLIGSALAGIVIHGIGGTGKTTLAAELVNRVRDQAPGLVLVSLAGPLTLEGLFDALVSGIRPRLLIRADPGAAEAVQALGVVARADVSWQDRLAVLRQYVLDRVPVLVLLDNFEDNLRPDGAGYVVGDEAVGGLIGAWAADPGQSRLLITCRYRFTLPGGPGQSLSFRQLGALSRAETMKLAWSLPALDRLDEGQLDRVWRLAGGHPRSLEYLDALLSGGTARYPDVTARLGRAVGERLGGAGREEWLAARTGLDAALAETIALAADDVLLDQLLTQLDQVPGAGDLLLGVSVYREPVDVNAVLFQAGEPDQDAAHVPDRDAARGRITAILAAAGITVDESFDMAAVPGHIQAELAPYLAELNREPVPAFRPPPALGEQVAACQAASLLTVGETGAGQARLFVHRWTATELAGRAARDDGARMIQVHRRAAAYWRWRQQVWPQDRVADMHDLLEARYHLLQAGDAEEAGQVTEWVVSQLDAWGAWDQEASLIHETLVRLPADSPRHAAWIHQLGILAQKRGDYDEAERHYRQALDINERLRNETGIARGHHQLGMIAQDRGDYDAAERHYQRALDIKERLDDQVDMAITYGQLGNLARIRSDHDEAERQYRRALEIFERLGNQVGMAACYHQLGMLASDRGDDDEAARQYQRSLDINEELGNQADMASSYHELGILAHNRGDYDEAERQYQRSLDIKERLGNQAGMASSYHQLGILAQDRGDHDEAARQYQRAIAILERLGNQADVATSYSRLGLLEAERGRPAAVYIGWELRALAIRLRIDPPQARNNLERLAGHRRELGTEAFRRALEEATGDTETAANVMGLLDQLDAPGAGTEAGSGG